MKKSDENPQTSEKKVTNYPSVPNNRWGLYKRRGPTDKLNINKQGVQIKGRVWKMFPDLAIWLISIKPKNLTLHYTDFQC